VKNIHDLNNSFNKTALYFLQSIYFEAFDENGAIDSVNRWLVAVTQRHLYISLLFHTV